MTANEIKLLRWAVVHAGRWLATGDEASNIKECHKILRRESAALKATLASRAKRKGTRK